MDESCKTIAVEPPQENLITPEDSRNCHPLLINHVLDKLFHCLTGDYDTRKWSSVIKDATSCRLVCKLWYERITPIYQMSLGRHNFRNFYGSQDAPKLEQFIDVMKNSKMIPVQSFTMNFDIFLVQNGDLINQFMKICGPETVQLAFYFESDDIDQLYTFSADFEEWNLEKLESLEISFRRFDTDHQKSPAALNKLLTSAKNLHKFEFSIKRSQWHSGDKAVGDIYRHLPHTLKVLELETCRFPDLHWECLAESDMKLEECKFTVSAQDDSCRNRNFGVRSFFKQQSTVLQKLSLGKMATAVLTHEGLKLEELNYLKLDQPIDQPIESTYPKLEKLEIFASEATLRISQLPEDPILSVKELTLNVNQKISDFVEKAGKSFPNTKKLYILNIIDMEECLRQVFTYFLEVEELAILRAKDSLTQNGDSLLSGVPAENCTGFDSDNYNDVNISELQRNSSILNLTKLTELHLDGNSGITFTDFSIHFVFLKMDKLQKLYLQTGEDFFKVSGGAMDLLRRSVNKLDVDLY